MSSGVESTAHTVAAGVLTRAGRVLLCHRRPDLTWYPNVWDLVGGHIEAGESAREALARECREELSITVLRSEQIPVDTGDPLVEVALFLVHTWRGEPVNAAPWEHDRIAWYDAASVASLPLADPRYVALLGGLLGR